MRADETGSKASFNFNNDFLWTTFQFNYMPISILSVTLTCEDLQQKSQFTKQMNLQPEDISQFQKSYLLNVKNLTISFDHYPQYLILTSQI